MGITLPHRILVIEDEHDLLLFMKMRLESNGYEVIEAVDGKEGLEKAHRENPDLILLDLMLPKIDGYWVCNLLKHDKRYAKIPIIVVTAKSGAANMKLAKECGADAYVAKPFEIEGLLAKIKHLLK
ncbi:MAG: response regulator [Candidatus Omnitrophica bacterium]|nr:response regulator [Candidatus Omnitrophota bacterium]MDD5436335.1 response regulator [Candidatus Omnitrophota bacterium]